MSARLGRAFFGRRAVRVAPDLLGRTLVWISPTGTHLRVRIVETEAYEPGDPASHAYRGLTTRNTVMFGPPGHLYVYFVYGVHWCANVVTGQAGEGSAVLLRAGEPIDGVAEMSRNRDDRTPLTVGPGRLAQALGISGVHNGLDLTIAGGGWFEGTEGVRSEDVAMGPRIGVREAASLPRRFWERGNVFVSGPRKVKGSGAPEKP